MLRDPAWSRWLESDPAQETKIAVADWIEQCTLFGPPLDTENSPEGIDTSTIENAGVVVHYLAVEQDELIIVKQFVERPS